MPSTQTQLQSLCRQVHRQTLELGYRLGAPAILAARPLELQGHHRAYRRYVILAHARSGSNLLVYSLRSDPRVVSFGEIFHPHDTLVMPLSETPGLRYLHRQRPLQFLQQAVYGGYARGIEAVGFKVFPDHVPEGGQLQPVKEWLASQRDIAVIHLTRRNLLRYYVSLCIARKTAVWISPSHKQGRNAAPSLRIDPREAEAAFTRRLSLNAASRSPYAHHPMLEMTYEALEAAPQAEFARVQAFLGLASRPLEIRTSRQEQRPLTQIIENYAELERRWRGTPWGEFLDA